MIDYIYKSDGDTNKITTETERGSLRDVLSTSNNWLTPNGYLKIYGKKFIKDMGFDVDKPKGGAKIKIPKKRIVQIERNKEEIDDNSKQFAWELNKLPTSEDNQDYIIFQDIINKNEIAAGNSIKLIETSLVDISVETSTQAETGGLTLRELLGLDKELRTISGSLRSEIAKSMTKQVDIDKEKQKFVESCCFLIFPDRRYQSKKKCLPMCSELSK